MQKENSARIWKMIQEAGDYLQDKLPNHPNHPKGRNPYAHVALCIKTKFNKSYKDIDDVKFNEVVDYIEYFELVYHLRSLRNNTTLIIKTKCFGREEITVPSITSVWRGAELQEREIWDLMGINFSDHPNMKRILLWEGFPGHPLRKDFIR